MLAELFKTEERVSVLRYVMFIRDFNVTEISRETGISKGLVSRYLRLLVGCGLLQRDGRRYSSLDDSYSRAIRLLLNMDKMNPLAIALGSARGIGIYGSWARGTNHHDSDLDVWIIADRLPPETELARLQRALSLQAAAEVNLLVLTPDKLERLKVEDPPFYNSLVYSSVTLKGESLEEYR